MTTHGELPAFPDPHLQPTLSVPAAGLYLGLGRAQAYAAASRGEIPILRVGRRILVPTALLARALGLPGGTQCSPDVNAHGCPNGSVAQ